MKLYSLVASILLFVFNAVGQDKPAYRIFNGKGKRVSYKKMLKTLKKKDLVFFGEFHNNPIAHWLEFEILQDLHKERSLILGAEMFEADNQASLSAYLRGQINTEELEQKARLWNNYPTDYAPLVDFAREQQLDFIATNIPRRYASMVYKQGGFSALDSLSKEEKNWIVPMPIPFDIELPRYKAMLDMMGGHGGEDIVKAQAIKDATMAFFILKNYRPNHLFLHFNGAYHSDYYEGILWYIKQQNKGVTMGTISTVSQENLKKLDKEHKGKADFIICVDSNMTTTY